jgi:histidinol-phosphate aminotransferase
MGDGMASINPSVLHYRLKDYAETDASKCAVDCSMGVNPRPLPDAVLRRLAGLSEGTIKRYPHDPSVIDLLIERFAPAAVLGAENFCLGAGSFDLLCNLNLLYAGSGKRIFSYAPQFSAYVDNAHCIGADYRFYPLDRGRNYRLNTEDFIAAMGEAKPALVCCENPNNPTGQVIAKEELARIVEAAGKIGAALLFDEAYADYLPLECSALAHVPGNDHVFVTRSFSKAFGMAGIRFGYVVGPADAVAQLKKLVTPFNANALARPLAAAALAEGDFLGELEEWTRRRNEKLYDAVRLTGKFRIAETDVRTPICVLYTEDESVDLRGVLAEAGIAAVGGLSYDNLGQNAVRLMLCEDIDRLIRHLDMAVTLIK